MILSCAKRVRILSLMEYAFQWLDSGKSFFPIDYVQKTTTIVRIVKM